MQFDKAKILVIGDLILDEYIWGDVERISPEAPVPIVWANRKTPMLGGAANVANNIHSLGAEVFLVGVVGNDKNKDILLAELMSRKMATRGIFTSPEVERNTTVKTRVIARQQQLLRIDWEHTKPLPRSINLKMIDIIRKNIDYYDALIIEDYGKGVISPEILTEVIPLARDRRKIITVDPKENHFAFYRGVTSITPNLKEFNNFHTTGVELVCSFNLDSLLVTMGEKGMRLYEKNGKDTYIPTIAQEVYDISGAGDTVIAVFTLALCCGATHLEAAQLANKAAGIVVGKIGTAVVTRKELE
jgi:rfaE bifunctional protein kinase chain/domain